MNALHQFASSVFEKYEQKYYIYVPYGKLIWLALKFMLAAIFMITLTLLYPMAVIFSIPALAFVIYFYYFYGKVWISYGLSKLYLCLMPILSVAISFGNEKLFRLLF